VTAAPPDWEADWLALVGRDTEFQLISRWTRVSLRMIGAGFDRIYRIERSAIGVAHGQESPTVTLTGSADAWAAFLSATPQPPNHHILAMQRRREDFSIDGRHTLLQHLRVLNRVLDLLRVVAAGREEVVA
jgi:hypothetical protein